jgi:uncharacterized DUF497 family protein
MEFVWDPRKAATNLRKHKVSFEEAVTALKDTLSITARVGCAARTRFNHRFAISPFACRQHMS